jgi:transcriptional regulator with XRE-family HTH domain
MGLPYFCEHQPKRRGNKMETLSTICNLLKIKKLKQKDLTDYLGLSKYNFTDWKAGRTNSYMKYLPQISEFLNVSVDYLLGREEIQKKADTLSDIILDLRSNSDLLNVVQNLRTLSPDELKAVNLFITTFKK